VTAPLDTQRIDLWLWRARLFKTRSRAERAVEAGGVRLVRGEDVRLLQRASVAVRAGDVLVVATEAGLRAVRVAALGARRGPAAEARALYEEVPASLDA
jgi:ribosome-associated heat shock protein Hsp15